MCRTRLVQGLHNNGIRGERKSVGHNQKGQSNRRRPSAEMVLRARQRRGILPRQRSCTQVVRIGVLRNFRFFCEGGGLNSL